MPGRANFIISFQRLADGYPQVPQDPPPAWGTTYCQANNLKKFPAEGLIFMAAGKGFESQRFCRF
jgi:hypothetical protein